MSNAPFQEQRPSGHVAESDGSNRVVVIWNPNAGKRRGRKRIRALETQLASSAEFLPTTHPGHAMDLARHAVLKGATRVIAAGGDGTAHEVANGIILAHETHTPPCLTEFWIAPIGSANDYVDSLRRLQTTAGVGKGSVAPVDVGSVRGSDGRKKYFIAGLGLGINGLVTLESQQIRWLQGLSLYAWAALRVICRFHKSPHMSVQINGGIPIVGPTTLMSVLLARREGNFPLAPNARLDDGWFNWVHAAVSSRWELLKLLPQVAVFGPPQQHPAIQQGLCQTVRVMSSEPFALHTDGEMFCKPSDGIQDVEISLLPRHLLAGVWIW